MAFRTLLSVRLVSVCFVGQALIYALASLLASDLVPQWGRWYSQSTYHRRQVESFLSGSLNLSQEPSALRHDLCWSQGGLHQVWGLGIPLYRLPFEAVARIVGVGSFPDMLGLAIALGLAAWAVVRALFEGGFCEPSRLGALTPNPSPLPSSAFGTISRSTGDENRWTGEAIEPVTLRLARLMWLAEGAALLLFFPPFVNLLQSRFEIYEEVIVYEYLFGLGLIAALLIVAQSGSGRTYRLLCVLAGVGGFFRPTLVLHGAAAIFAGAVALRFRKGALVPTLLKSPHRIGQTDSSSSELAQKPLPPHTAICPSGEGGVPSDDARLKVYSWSRWGRTVAAGVGLFVLGNGLLFLTNYARFGNGFEFGHRLNVQHLYGSLYATRFDHPYQEERLLSAGRELFGWLFLTKEFSGGDFYQDHIFPGQSPTVRWREVYLTTYDLTYLPWLLSGLMAGAVAWWRWRKRCLSPVGGIDEPQDARPDLKARATCTGFTGSSLPPSNAAMTWVNTLALYGAVASALLLGFYLRSPIISSRYLLDLMPSFAALMLAGWLAWGEFWLKRAWGRWVLNVSTVLLVVWLGWELSRGGSTSGAPHVLTWKEVVNRKNSPPHPVRLPVSGVYASCGAPAETGIPYNGAGWQEPSGMLMPCVILFVDAPAFLECEMAPYSEATSREGPVALRAKVGLEYLQRQSMVRSQNGWVVRFAGPQRRRYQKGLQPVFLATVPKEHLADNQTPWRLLNVRWRKTEGNK